MKRTIYLLISLLVINCSNLSGKGSLNEERPPTGDSIKLLSTPDLYNLSVKWADEYKRIYPETKIQVISVSGSRIAANLLEKGNFGFVSNESYSGFESEKMWKAVIGRDVIVPVISSKNPFLEEIYQHGISTESFARLLNNKDSQNWGALLKNGQNSPVNYYYINEESVKSRLAGFLRTGKIIVKGNEVGSSEEMISAIQKDPYSIGFCKMVNILDNKNQTFLENIRLVPIDRNGNGLIDYNEKIFDDYNVFSRGVWIGKYPKSLISNIYSVSANQPGNDAEIAFLKWVITDGQQFLYSSGYSDLLISERQNTVDRLYNAKIYAGAAMNDKSLFIKLLFVITTVILVGLILDGIARYKRRKKAAVQIDSNVFHSVFNENSLVVPAGLYFDKTHTWAFMEQNGSVKVGIDDFLQHITGNITRIKMKNKGEKVKKGEQILSIIQNGKQLNLYSPVSGIIIEHNKKLETNSSVLNSSPYNDGWVYKIEPTNWLRENQLLFMADKHRQFIKNEFTRLKEFLTVTLKSDTEKYPWLVLQDGGELRDGVLSDLGPEVWEDFQTNYIDPSRQIWFYELF
jgi:glycine cleavage system H lipoate-binding protein/ABC-type phosphate transport system substrate-binding protein